MNVHIDQPTSGQSAVAERILRALPEWFGIEASLVQYVNDADVMPTLVARVDDEAVGFLTLNRHFEHAAEVHAVGVLPQVHRRGVGRALQLSAEAWLTDEGIEYLQVKTVGPSSDDAFYARTREFYLAMGFRPLEEIKTLWDERNPCLILIKRL